MHPLKLPLSNSACRCADLPWPIHWFVSVDLRFVLAISSPTEVRPGPLSHTTTVQSNPFELRESAVLPETSFQLLSTWTWKGPCTLTAGNREPKPIYSTASNFAHTCCCHGNQQRNINHWLYLNAVLCLKVIMRIVSRACRLSWWE